MSYALSTKHFASVIIGYWLLVISYWFIAAPAALAGAGACVNNGAPSFSCPTPPNTDVCGSGGSFLCKVAPTCGSNESNNCADPNCACACNSGFVRCQTSGACVAVQSCPSGTTFNPCTGGCDTPYVLRSPAAAQAGDINVTGVIQSGGGFKLTTGAGAGKVLTSDASGLATWQTGSGGGGGGGGLSGTGIANYVARFTGASTLGTGLLYDDGINIGIRTPTPGYILDARDPGATAIIRLVNDNAAKKYTGLRLDRTGLAETWFVGMNDADDSFRIRRAGLSDDLVITAGVVQLAGLKLPTGASAGSVLISDAAGVGSWQSPACFGGKFVGFTSAAKVNGARGGYFTSISGGLPVGGMIGQCQSAFAGTHICTTEEIFRTIACNPSALPTGGTNAWVSSGPPGYTSPASNDCVGWTSGNNSDYGTFWKFNPNGGSSYSTGCDQTFYVACCK